MFKYYHYVPVLKWKRGEQIGLANCIEETKKSLTPLIEIPPIPWDYNNECQSCLVDEHISDIASTILKSFGPEKPFFIDVSLVDPEFLKSGDHIISIIFTDALKNKLTMIPVVSLHEKIEFYDSIKNILNKKNNGICLRVCLDDFDDENIFKKITEDLFKELSIKLENVDLVVDFGYLSEPVPMITIASIINNFVYDIEKWRTFTLVSSSFPFDMSEIERDSIETLTRIEWQMWESLLLRFKAGKIKRMPTYGDYVIANPEMTEIDPRTMNISGNIRYTIMDDYLIIKGAAVRDVKRGGVILKRGRGYTQMKSLCQALVKRSEFMGATFSWGDRYIEDCANGKVSNGNAETWRRVGTNHHLTLVSGKLSTHGDS
ncbi:MAG: hypothetical protein A2W19_16520 [Spirochaetes bacterium RBG_16_49_21]|nr:MAG: hypothetical protein A2W19_16520 [Spirochaetes bacterium RBG_16_49_21]